MSRRANPTARPIPIELDRPRHLLLDFNALALIEEKTGKNTLDGATWSNMTASTMRVFLWACLLHEDPSLTLEQVGKMLTPASIPAVTEAIQKVMAVSMPEGGGEGPKENLPNG